MPIVKSPRVLIAATELFTNPELGFDEDIKAIRELGGSPPTIARNLTSDMLKELMTHNKFDIVHLLVYVGQENGDLIFSQHDKLNADGFGELVKLTGARLVILATCDSVVLGAKISRIANVISAASQIEVPGFLSWEKSFFSVLAQKYTVAQAYDISRSIAGLPFVLHLKADLAFDVN